MSVLGVWIDHMEDQGPQARPFGIRDGWPICENWRACVCKHSQDDNSIQEQPGPWANNGQACGAHLQPHDQSQPFTHITLIYRPWINHEKTCPHTLNLMTKYRPMLRPSKQWLKSSYGSDVLHNWVIKRPSNPLPTLTTLHHHPHPPKLHTPLFFFSSSSQKSWLQQAEVHSLWFRKTWRQVSGYKVSKILPNLVNLTLKNLFNYMRLQRDIFILQTSIHITNKTTYSYN